MSGGKDINVVSRPGADVATRDSIPYGITVTTHQADCTQYLQFVTPNRGKKGKMSPSKDFAKYILMSDDYLASG